MTLNNLQKMLTSEVQNSVLATGTLPTWEKLAGAGGSVTYFAQQYGTALIEQAIGAGGKGVYDVLKLLSSNDGTLNISGVISAVFAAIGRIVNSIKDAGEEYQRNFTVARTTLLSSQFGVRNVLFMPSVFCGGDGMKVAGEDGAGCYNFPRPGVAEDRCIPYFDPLGYSYAPYTAVTGSMPAFCRPYLWPMEPDEPINNNWTPPMGFPGWGVGFRFNDECYKNSVLLLDTGKQDCGDQHYSPMTDNPRLSICWAWAWPLTSPMRIAGQWSRYSHGDGERTAAGLFLLPTPQHLQARMSDVIESERILRLAMGAFYPTAYEAEPGLWMKSPQKNGGIVPPLPIAMPGFESLAESLRRVHAFKRVRAAILASMAYLPQELLPYLGSDFPGGETIGDTQQAPYQPGVPRAHKWVNYWGAP